MADTITGILKHIGRGHFVVRTPDRSYRKPQSEIAVPPQLAHQYKLCEGAAVTGKLERKKGQTKLISIETLAGMDPKEFAKRPRYSDLVAIDPHQRFDLSTGGNTSMRIIDLIAPIGKGSRQMIVSPPKAGKTVLLEQMATAIHQCSPDTRVIVLLIDERPEEVTQFKRTATNAEVIASTSDQSANEHVELAQLLLSHIQTELECGKDVVLLIDSLTRIGRAFNNAGQPGQNRRRATMSGGLSAGAMQIPRKLFGLARTIENGGSVTIIATCLINTGSRMDQLIFEEFKGTGNSEIILDRALAEQRIFPAIDIPASGTRKENKLYSEQHNQGLTTLRRVLSNYGTRNAMQSLFKLMDKYPNNMDFLQSMSTG
ncbi:MAG: transcription termination factor Rho [Planctomycetes bacterium]|nr:transcription termination factor Rho [Planctomycetota bacterium]